MYASRLGPFHLIKLARTSSFRPPRPGKMKVTCSINFASFFRFQSWLERFLSPRLSKVEKCTVVRKSCIKALISNLHFLCACAAIYYTIYSSSSVGPDKGLERFSDVINVRDHELHPSKESQVTIQLTSEVHQKALPTCLFVSHGYDSCTAYMQGMRWKRNRVH